MKKIFLLFLLFIFCNKLSAQKTMADSFLQVLNSKKIDSVQTEVLLNMSTGQLGDSLGYYSRKVIGIGIKQKNKNVEAIGSVFLGYVLWTHDDKPQAMELILKALRLAEEENNKKVLARVYHFTTFIYQDYRGIEYALKSRELSKQTGEKDWECYALIDLLRFYYDSGKYDSALIYASQAYETNLHVSTVGKARESLHISIPYHLGNIHLKLNNLPLALTYYRQSLQAGLKYNSLRTPYIGMTRFYKETNNRDSALYYARKLFEQYELNPKGWNTQPAEFLYKIYKEKGNADSALKYYEIFNVAKDGRLNIDKAEKMENLRFAEELRQKELLSQKQKDAEERNHNLQYAAIVIGLIAFVILFLLLSRSIVVKTKFIEFFGVLGLLAVFEFINLFIHPYLAHATNDSPVLMLAVLIAIGALLIPLHHRLEKWITKIMVEKNKKIRLEAAKKTIQQLEGK
jgi:tetratricopeptide (TPR) repeat protein